MALSIEARERFVEVLDAFSGHVERHPGAELDTDFIKMVISEGTRQLCVSCESTLHRHVVEVLRGTGDGHPFVAAVLQ
jgi:hypothetical protein